MRRKIRDSPLG